MPDPKAWFSNDLEVKGWFGAEPLEYWFDPELYSPVTNFPSSASDSTFVGITTTSMVAITDVLQVRTDGVGTLTFTGALSFEPQTLTNGVYNTAAIWRYRTVGGSWTDVGTEISATNPSTVTGGVLDTAGDIDVATTQALSASTNYEVQLYARRISASPANTINFTGTASVSGGSAGQTVTQTSLFTDGDTFYAGSISQRVNGTLYTDADTFYAGTVAQRVNGGLYTDADTFYAGGVTTRINGTLYTDSDTFYGGTVTTGIPTQTVTQNTLYTDADTFYAGALSGRISQSTLYTDSDTFYAGTLAQTLSGALYEDADTFYGGTVASNVTATQSALFDDGDTFYAGTVTDSNVAPRSVVSGKQAQTEWEARQKWRKQAETLLIDEPAPEVVQEVAPEAIEVDAILPRLYEPVESLAELVADARLLQLDEARALESAMAVKDVLAIAELAYLAEVAVQQEKDAIAAFIMFME
jgi:hypothetical protein